MLRSLAILLIGLISSGCQAKPADTLAQIELPPGFQISYFAQGVEDARSLVASENGTLFVSTRGRGNIYALRDADSDGVAEQRWLIASGRNTPNGIALHKGALYVAEINQIIRYDAIETRLDNPPQPVVVTDKLPAKTHHGWRYIAIGPDGDLYISIGAPCNVCDESGFGEIRRLNLTTGKMSTYARGVRNSVGLTWHPLTNELWFTDNGRDWLGDNRPPDELNRAPGPGYHYGFPACHGADIEDPRFNRGQDCGRFTPPVQSLGPHVASLGLRFYTGTQFPDRYHNQIFIAEHGSWNRSQPIGYRVTMVTIEQGKAISYRPFAQGWLANGRAWGRPVDLQVWHDGSLLVSDDKVGAIYRISYDSKSAAEKR